MPLGKGLDSLIPRKDGEDDMHTAPLPAILPQEDGLTVPPPEPKQAPPKARPQSGEHSPISPPVAQPIANEAPPAPLSPKAGQHHAKRKTPEAIFHIEVHKIKPNPHQPRRDFDEESLKELAASIREFGILQPLVVSKTEKETDYGTDVEYQLIAGERRLKAAQMLGWERVPAIIRSVDLKSERLEMAIVENLQRADLNPVEIARAYAKLQDEFGLTQREIGARLGKSRETISNTLRLLNLSTEIQEALSKNKINESQARLLLAIPSPKEQQALFQELLSRNLSVRELKSRIRKTLPETKRGPKTKAVDPEIQILQERLTAALGAEVKIDPPAGDEKQGKIIISFYSPEEIRGIIEKINPQPE